MQEAKYAICPQGKEEIRLRWERKHSIYLCKQRALRFLSIGKEGRRNKLVRILEKQNIECEQHKKGAVYSAAFSALSHSMLCSPTQVDPQSDSVLNFNHNLSYTVAWSYIQTESPHHTSHLP